MTGRKMKIASEYEIRETKWLWYPYIPLGKVTILYGESGSGKSLFLMRLIAACTGKVKIDKETGYLGQGSVLYMTNEEKPEAFILPRLAESGARNDKVFIINDGLSLTLSDDELEHKIIENGIQLMIIDPFSEYLAEPGMMLGNPEQVISIIRMLERVAENTGCAIILSVQTFAGDSGVTDLWLSSFGTHVSGYLSMEWDEEMEYDERTLYHERSHLTLEGLPVDYRISETGGMCPKSFF